VHRTPRTVAQPGVSDTGAPEAGSFGSQARFKLRASVQDIDYQHRRNLKEAQATQLAQINWLERGQDLLITDPCVSGKTYLGCAIGHQTYLNGLSARYYPISRLLLTLTQARADGIYQKVLGQVSKVQLLILDSWGLEVLIPAHRNDLIKIMGNRHETHSIAVISQLQWSTTSGPFHWRIVSTISSAAHALLCTITPESLAEFTATVLAALVRVEHDL
jgi:DNA replication protein DnaC